MAAIGDQSGHAAGGPAFADCAWEAAMAWVGAAALAALYVLHGAPPIDGGDVVVGVAVGLGVPGYQAWGDRDQLFLRRLPAAPEALTTSGRSLWRLLGAIALVGALLVAAHLLLPEDWLNVGAVGVLVPAVLAAVASARAAQIRRWKRRHPGMYLVRLTDDDGRWIAVQTVSAWSEAEAAFGR